MQRIYGKEQQVAVLSPILIGTDGINKMSKTMNNYIAVFDTPNDKYGKVMSIPDSLIIDYYNYATRLDPDDIALIKQELAGGANPMHSKKRLAREIVKLYHGEEASLEAEAAFAKVFSQRDIPDDIPEYTTTEDKVRLIKLLTDNGLCSSNSEARRMVAQNAVSVNNEKWTEVDGDLTLADGMVIKVGKRKFLRVRKG